MYAKSESAGAVNPVKYKNDDRRNNMSCSGECNGCESGCGSAGQKAITFEPANQYSSIKKVIGVVSGKGGVGKSLSTSYLSVLMNRKGYNTAILDADITGPSIPKAFGIKEKAQGNDFGLLPAVSKKGTKVMSVNLLLDSEEMPVVWRGPIIAGTVKQFWTDVLWDKVDYMFVDMPPGTGDVPLTVFQSIPLDGIVIVTSPQELVSMIVAKAVNMAKAMNVPILGVIENYSYISCGNCGEKISVFGESHVDEVAAKYNLKVLDRIPIDPAIAKAIDGGNVEDLQVDYLSNTANYIEQELSLDRESVGTVANKTVIAVPVDGDNKVNAHFGKTEAFRIYEFEESTLVNQGTLRNEASGHDEVAAMLLAKNVQVVLCNGIGMGALQALMDQNVQVYPGLEGDVDVVVASYLDGAIVNGGFSTCSSHSDDSSCSCGGNCGCH